MTGESFHLRKQRTSSIRTEREGTPLTTCVTIPTLGDERKVLLEPTLVSGQPIWRNSDVR